MSAADVDAYIAGFSPEIAERLTAVREALLRAVPGADEVIRYDMPAVMLGGRYAIHFAGWKQHIGLYPVPGLDAPLEQQVAPLRSGRDSVVLKHHVPLPIELVERIAVAIVAQRGRH